MSLFNIGLSGLNTAQNALQTVSHNMSNSATLGFTRQNTILASAGGQLKSSGFYGQGSNAITVIRVYDEFLAGQLRDSQTVQSQLAAYSDQISQIDNLLADSDAGLAPLLQGFFKALQGVADKPADSAARQSLLNAAQSLTGQMRSTSSYFKDLQKGVNDQLGLAVSQVNTYTKQIASLNAEISKANAQGNGQPPNDLLDQRDQLISELNTIVGVKVVTQDSGTINVFVGNGQPLVMGKQSYDMQAVNSAADPSRKVLAYTMSNGTTVEMDDTIFKGGQLSGLLEFRRESLDAAQNAIGRLSLALGQNFNDQMKLGMDLNGDLGGDLFSIGSPRVIANKNNTGTGTVGAAISDTSALTTSDYEVQFDGTNYNLVRLSDNTTVATGTGTTLTAEGLTITIGAGMAAGDRFQVQPTRTVADQFDVVIKDPAKIAAAAPASASATTTNKGSGTAKVSGLAQGYDIDALPITATWDATAGAYTFTDKDGVAILPDATTPNGTATEFTFNGVTLSLDGAPADGDTFKLGNNSGAISDNSNALALIKLQTAETIGGISNFNDAYALLVNDVGSKTKSIDIALKSQSSVTKQVDTAFQSVSGVNMDEELVSLLRFNQLYQASAKVIDTATQTFDTLLALG